MRFVRRHWYNLGLAVAVICAMWAFVGALTTVQLILLLNFIVPLFIKFEEYAWPGGASPSNSDGQKANDTAEPFACEENYGTTIRPTRQVLRSRDASQTTRSPRVICPVHRGGREPHTWDLRKSAIL